MGKKHHPHGPSKTDKLNECLSFEGKATVGKAAHRGTGIHLDTTDHMEGKRISTDPLILRTVDRIRKHITTFIGIEHEMDVHGEGFELLTFGTCDAYGWDATGNQLVVLDIKTGVQPADSYKYQLACYALAAMEEQGESSCRCVIIPVDDDENDAWSFMLDLDQAKEMVYGLFNRIKVAAELPRKNQYCNWCAKQSTCPVWVDPAKVALTLVNALPERISPEWIMASPVNAGLAKTMLKSLQAIFENIGVDDRIKEALEAGQEVPGWKLQSRKGSERLDTKAVKARWKELTDEPIPSTIGEATVSLVQSK